VIFTAARGAVTIGATVLRGRRGLGLAVFARLRSGRGVSATTGTCSTAFGAAAGGSTRLAFAVLTDATGACGRLVGQMNSLTSPIRIASPVAIMSATKPHFDRRGFCEAPQCLQNASSSPNCSPQRLQYMAHPLANVTYLAFVNQLSVLRVISEIKVTGAREL
jgi:hypothetical protein